MNRLSINYIAYFILAASAGLGIFTREIWLVIPMLAALVFVRKNKPQNKEDKEKLEDFSNKVLAGSIILPIGLIFVGLILLVAYIIIRKYI